MEEGVQIEAGANVRAEENGNEETPLSLLQKAYDTLYGKYQSSKARNVAQMEKWVQDQKRKRISYSKAADALVDSVRKDNLWLQHQLDETRESRTRVKELEKENALLRNDLAAARAKSDNHQCGSIAEGRYRLMQKVFEQLASGLQIIDEGSNSPAIIFLHQESGLTFQLEQVDDRDIAQLLCDGHGELRFTSISLGTLSRVAPDWMREAVTFSISQAPAFFHRIRRVTKGS